DKNEPPSHAAHPPRRLHPALRSRCMRPVYDYAKKAYKITSKLQGWELYCDEIEVQKTHSNHRKLDSQATPSLRARGRAADGLRSQVWSLRASRRDHDPGRLSARSAGVRGLRPAMAADRAIRGPPACSPRQERDFQRASD